MTRVCTLGDALIDIIVEPAQVLVPDDDVPAHITLTVGGQAANVAAWSVALGSTAAVITKLGDDPAGELVRDMLTRRGVEVHAPPAAGTTGTIVSLVGRDGRRTMTSDRGNSGELTPDQLRAEWFIGCSWLHLSGYALLDPLSGLAALQASALARSHGARVSVDVSTATLIATLGAAETRRRLVSSGAAVVFANEAEARALGDASLVATLVIKRGAAGYRVRSGNDEYEGAAAPGGVARDTTGAGDAFAAGWLVGGPSLAVQAARGCIAEPGAMPAVPGTLAGRRVDHPTASTERLER